MSAEAASATGDSSSSTSPPSASALARHPLAAGPLSLGEHDENDDSIPASFNSQATIRGLSTIRASKGSSSASQTRPGYFDLQRLAAAQSDFHPVANAVASSSGSHHGQSTFSATGSNGAAEQRTPQRKRSSSRASRSASIYSSASSSHRYSIDGSGIGIETGHTSDVGEGDDDGDDEEDDTPSWLKTIRARSPLPQSSASAMYKTRPITQVIGSSNPFYADSAATPPSTSTDTFRRSLFPDDKEEQDKATPTDDDIEAQLKAAIDEANQWKRAFEEQKARHAREILALQKASEARETALLDILTAAGISKARAERALTHATAQSQVPVFKADERIAADNVSRARSPLPPNLSPHGTSKRPMSPGRSISGEDQLPASIMEAMLDDFQADLHYHQSQMDRSRPPSVSSESRPHSPTPSVRSTISRATQAASSVTSMNGFFTTLNWRRKKSPSTTAQTKATSGKSATKDTSEALANVHVQPPTMSSPSADAATTLNKTLIKDRRKPTSSKAGKQSEPNVTRLPGLFGQTFGGQVTTGSKSVEQNAGGENAQSLTQELEPMLAHDLRPPSLTLAARRRRLQKGHNVAHLKAALEPEDVSSSTPTLRRPHTIKESDGVDSDEYQSSGDEFEVYGGKHLTPEELAQRVSSTIQKQREAGAEDAMLTDRYGFVYDATPADVRLLRRARKEASHAPACLTGIRVGVRARGGTDSQSEGEKEDDDGQTLTSDSEVEAVSTPGVKVEVEQALEPTIAASLSQASKPLHEARTPSPSTASSAVPDFLDVASCKPLVSASTLTAASQTSSKAGPTSPEEERLMFLSQKDASSVLDAKSSAEAGKEPNSAAVNGGPKPPNGGNQRPPNTSQTVRRLLAQLQEMHAAQQEEQQAAWDAFLGRRKSALRGKSETSAAEKQQQQQQSGAAGIVDAARQKGDPNPGPAEEEWTLGGLIGLGQMGSGTKDQQDFRKLVQGGIPLVYRPKIWYECSGAIERAEPGRYEELLKEHENEENTCTKQIDLDVGRTMPTNIYFAGDGPGVPKLRRLLVAYSWYNPKCGYCQGMNNLAATLLLTHATEEEAFWVLASIVEDILPQDYFTSHLLVAQADQRVLIDLVREQLPKVSKHIDALGVDLPAVTFAWFLSLYTDCLPVETLFRTWDVLFVEGVTVLFRIAMAIFTMNEREILAVESPSTFYSLMHSMTSHLFSADALIALACEELRTTIKREKVEERRTMHMRDLCAELGLDFESLTADPQSRTPSTSSIQQPL